MVLIIKIFDIKIFKNTKIINVPKYINNIKTADKKLLASNLKLNYEEQEDFVSTVFLVLKVCFFLLAIVSLVKIGYSSKVRLTRLKEIKDSYSYEKSRFDSLSRKFDDLISFEGEQRFMKDQDQMISKDIIRVIWRR